MAKNLFIHHHLGLGDHFDCNGLVRYILKKWQYDTVSIFSKDNYFSMVDFMYRDEDNIKVVKIDKNKEYEEVLKIVSSSNPEFNALLTIGHSNYDHNAKNKNCWEIFYDQVEIPYNVRKDFFHIDRDLEEEERVFSKLNPANESFLFLHDDKERGFNLNRDHILNTDLRIIENDVTENIFYFIKILQEAEEIHCMESSFKTLIDLYCEQDNLFFHDFRGHPLGQNSLKQWEIIPYE